jgi:hypothetical protein
MLIAPGAVTVSNIVIRERPYGPGAYYVELRLDLTVVEPVTRESAVSQTRLSCTSGGKMFDADLFVEIANRSSDRDSFSLHMLAPGETLRVGSNAFIETPLPAPPDRCDLRLTASALRSEVAFEVARFCVTKGEAVAGACSETR